MRVVVQPGIPVAADMAATVPTVMAGYSNDPFVNNPDPDETGGGGDVAGGGGEDAGGELPATPGGRGPS